MPLKRFLNTPFGVFFIQQLRSIMKLIRLIKEEDQ